METTQTTKAADLANAIEAAERDARVHQRNADGSNGFSSRYVATLKNKAERAHAKVSELQAEWEKMWE